MTCIYLLFKCFYFEVSIIIFIFYLFSFHLLSFFHAIIFGRKDRANSVDLDQTVSRGENNMLKIKNQILSPN